MVRFVFSIGKACVSQPLSRNCRDLDDPYEVVPFQVVLFFGKSLVSKYSFIRNVPAIFQYAFAFCHLVFYIFGFEDKPFFVTGVVLDYDT